jgi:hypothetical protein
MALLTKKQTFDLIRQRQANAGAAPPKGVTRPATSPPPATAPPAPKPKAKAKKLNLNKPLVAGSNVTLGDVLKAATAAAKVEFGGQLGEAQKNLGGAKAFATDLGGPGGFYDQYLAKLQQHATNVNATGQAASTAIQGLQAGVTGLGQQTLAPIQGQANAQAAATGMGPAGDLTGLADQALGVRQALVTAFGTGQAARNKAAEDYADALANVVGPQEKLGGITQARGKVEEARKNVQTVRGQIGAFKTKYISEAKDEATKNVIAEATLEGKTASELAKTTAAKTNSYGPGGVKQNKYGFTYDEWQKLPDKTRNDYRTGKNKPKGPAKVQTGYGPGLPGNNEYGFTYDQWTALPTKTQNDYRTGRATRAPTTTGTTSGAPGFTPQEAKEFQAKFKVAPASVARIDNGYNEIKRAKNAIKQMTNSGKDDAKWTRSTLGNQLMTGVSPQKNLGTQKQKFHFRAFKSLWAQIALDLWEHGGITARVAGNMHRLGYSARALGVPLLGPNPKPSAGNPNLGALPGQPTNPLINR